MRIEQGRARAWIQSSGDDKKRSQERRGMQCSRESYPLVKYFLGVEQAGGTVYKR